MTHPICYYCKVHDGQGLSNRCIYCEQAYLKHCELIQLENERFKCEIEAIRNLEIKTPR